MKEIVLKYGGLSVLVLIGISVLSLVVVGRCGTHFTRQTVITYTSMLLSMVFVYFGMMKYRDTVNGGTMSYLQGLKVGILITLLPSIAFGIFNVIYVKYIDPGFMERYYNHEVETMRAKLPAAEFATQLKVMEGKKEMFSNPFLSFLLMAVMVLIMGIVVSAISALILQRKATVQPA